MIESGYIKRRQCLLGACGSGLGMAMGAVAEVPSSKPIKREPYPRNAGAGTIVSTGPGRATERCRGGERPLVHAATRHASGRGMRAPGGACGPSSLSDLKNRSENVTG